MCRHRSYITIVKEEYSFFIFCSKYIYTFFSFFFRRYLRTRTAETIVLHLKPITLLLRVVHCFLCAIIRYFFFSFFPLKKLIISSYADVRYLNVVTSKHWEETRTKSGTFPNFPPFVCITVI